MTRTQRPAADESAPYYASYIDPVPDGDIADVLAAQAQDCLRFYESIPPDKLRWRYAPGKWTAQDVVTHIVDIERAFAYRAMRFARGDRTPLPGVDQDTLMHDPRNLDRPFPSLMAEYQGLRAANVALFRSFDDAVLDRRGVASGSACSVRAILYIIAGHELHHVRVLNERYVGANR